MPPITGSQPAPAPTCVTIAQRLADLQGFLADALATITANLYSVLGSRTNRSAADCSALIADVDAAYASMLASLQARYAALLAAASTATEKSAVSKAQADATTQLQTWRSKAIAEIDKVCQQAK